MVHWWYWTEYQELFHSTGTESICHYYYGHFKKIYTFRNCYNNRLLEDLKKTINDIDTKFEHWTINHSLHFVDPLDTSIHTQNIEALWSRSKYFLKKKTGASSAQRSDYLFQFLWMYGIVKKEIFWIIYFIKLQ